MIIRRVTRAEYAEGSFVEFPSHNYTLEIDQGLHNSFADLTGANYAYDMVGFGRSAKKNMIIRIGFWLVGTPSEVNEAYAALAQNLQGRIKLWSTDDVDEDSTEGVWAYARLVSMPSVSLNTSNRTHMPVTLIFEGMSDWQGEGS